MPRPDGRGTDLVYRAREFLADGIGSYVRGVSSSASMGRKTEITRSNRTMKIADYVSKTKQL